MKKPSMVKITPDQEKQLVEAVGASNLDPELGQFLIGLIHGNRWLVDALERGWLTITRLRKIFQVSTEKASDRTKAANGKAQDSTKTSPGHGHIAAQAYTGAETVPLAVEGLRSGDMCPAEYCDGRVYDTKDPGVFVKITGGPIARATRYVLEKLRCTVCQVIYTAALPAEVSSAKYDNRFIAMLMLHKYFIAVPFYRQEKLQQYLGVPLPSSTQWDLIAAEEEVLKAVYGVFQKIAADGKGICIDDTHATVLERLYKNKKEAHKKDRKGCYTTGIVSVHAAYTVYLFMTDTQTAGKSLAPLLALRDPTLPAPYLMCDALSANIPKKIDKSLYILCYCLVHARRNFYDLPDGYDDCADTVIALIGRIYDIEKQTKKMTSAERLGFHQAHSTPVMSELKAFLEARSLDYEPNGIAGKAIDYIRKRWTELSQFLRYPDTPLDNNITERALKLIIQQRKSSLFYKTEHGAVIASHIQTALYSAAQNNSNPYTYMTALLDNRSAVIEHPEHWMPWNYTAALPPAEEGNALHEDPKAPG